MDDVDFDKLEDLSISELEAIRAFAVEQMNECRAQIDKYKGSKTSEKHVEKMGQEGSYYEQLADYARNFLDGKIYDIIGKPKFE